MPEGSPIWRSFADSLADPKLVELTDNLTAVSFELMKMLPARHILNSAERRGELRRGQTIIESTSGSFGLALAMLARHGDYDLVLVCDGAIEPVLKRRLSDLGARLVIPPGSNLQAGAQAVRLARLEAVKDQIPDHFTPDQYDSPLNRRAYWALSDTLSDALGRIDCLVAAVGTGGSSCGTAERLRQRNPSLTLIGVDTPGSMLFGHGDEPRLLKGLGNSILPSNVAHPMFDDVHWVGAATAFRATRRLHREHAIFAGPTSGAAYLVAHWYAQRHPDHRVIVLMPDRGDRYEATVYDDPWLRENAWIERLPSNPIRITRPDQVEEPWCHLHWGRRTLAAVSGSRSVQAGAASFANRG